jgi:sugar phosphate isomerase/epimerase
VNRISFASGIVPEFGPLDTVRAAAAGGFDAVGLWVDPANWTDATTRDCRTALADTGLELLDVEVIWLKPGSDLGEHKACIDIGAALGANNVLCVTSDPDMAANAARLAELCQHAEGSGMRVALEFGIFTEVKNLKMARAVIDDVAHPLAAILIDPIHVDRSGTSIVEIAALPEALLPYAQFCDAPAKRPDPNYFDEVITDAIDLREQCGAGGLDLVSIYNALPSDITLSIELRSKALRDRFPDAGERAKQVAAATRAWLEANT